MEKASKILEEELNIFKFELNYKPTDSRNSTNPKQNTHNEISHWSTTQSIAKNQWSRKKFKKWSGKKTHYILKRY